MQLVRKTSFLSFYNLGSLHTPLHHIYLPYLGFVYLLIYGDMVYSKSLIFQHTNSQLHSVRGQSVFFNLALTEGNMQIKFDLKLSVYSLGLEI